MYARIAASASSSSGTIRSVPASVLDTRTSSYVDEMYSFFENCYHLKDRLKNDQASARTVTDIEAMITNSTSLSICADLANGSKHLTLTTSRSGDLATRFGPKHFSVSLGPGMPTRISAAYEVHSGSSIWDAFSLAEECMQEWRRYLTRQGLPK